ncbi:MAG: thioredoxin family protein [Oscillospiraceae bacterium]
MNKNSLAKILVIILIVLAILGVWLLKSKEQPKEIPLETGNSDFALFITEEIDLEKLKSYKLPIIIDFGSQTCPPCKKMAPDLKALNEELRDKAIVRYVDLTQYNDLANGFPVSVTPTQFLFNADGTPYMPSEGEAIAFNLYSSKSSDEHILTAHEGLLTKDEMLNLLDKMGMEK